jgi:hypothetical protein
LLERSESGVAAQSIQTWKSTWDVRNSASRLLLLLLSQLKANKKSDNKFIKERTEIGQTWNKFWGAAG